MKQYYVYILTNISHNVVYTGVTNDLVRRVWEHKQQIVKGFTQKYNVEKLVYYEVFYDPENAIKKEKAIKNLVRRKKEELIMKFNPEKKDLYNEIIR